MPIAYAGFRFVTFFVPLQCMLR